MGKTLIIAEKPDMGRSIAAAVEPGAVNRKTYLEGKRYLITWAIGHLLGLAEPDGYDEKYKKWRFDDLPILPDSFKLVPNARTRGQLKVIGELAKRCDQIVNACDAGREGQLIFDYIRTYLKLKQPVLRLWISDLTRETILKGFRELKNDSEYDNLTRAARSRSEADWLIGMNGSRAFTIRHKALFSVGRVQTPVLALICDRQKEIEEFRPERYYVVEAQFAQAPDTRYKGIWQGERLDDREKAVQIAGRVNGKAGVIAGYEAKESKEYPARLYDLTLLQREANARYGFSAQKTLDLAQALYEKHKVITYPRTSSNYVNEENIQGMHKALDALVDTAYGALAAGADRSRVHARNRAVCNPAMVEDHHAILPTRKKAGTLSPDEAKVYDLVVRRFLSHYYPPAEYTVHTILTEVERERFKTVLKELRHAGWKVVYEHSDGSAGKKGGRRSAETEEQEAETTVSGFALRIREPVQCRKAEVLDKETRPPKPYTEGTLLKAMESAGRQLEDEALREAMKDAGLGTPATRAAIIERLKQVGYVEMKGKQIAVTPKGRTAVELIRGAGIDLLTSPEMTGQWERRLNAIAKGLAADGPFLENVKRFSRLIVAKVAEQPPAAPGALEAAGGRGKRRAAGGRSPRSRGAAKGAAPAAAAPRNGGAFPPRAAARADGSRPAGAGMPAVARAARGGTAARLNEASSVRSSAVPPAAASAAAPAALPPPRTIGACPRPGCGGRIFMGRRGYGCSRYKDGCGFVIWKQSFGRSLTETMIRSLLTKGRTNRLKLTDASGRSYDARLVLVDRNTGKLGIES